MENDLSRGEGLDPLVTGGTDTSALNIDTLPKVVCLSGETESAVPMNFKERVKFVDGDLFCDVAGRPNHECLLEIEKFELKSYNFEKISH